MNIVNIVSVPHSPTTTSTCPHCKSNTESGTRGGCYNCGRVKGTRDGRVQSKQE